MITREQDRDMILNPQRWPLINLPLKRKKAMGLPETAVLCAPLHVTRMPADAPIEIYLGTIFDDLDKVERVTYSDVDALLDDGWVVD